MKRNCPLCGITKFAHWRFGLLICENCSLVVAERVWKSAANAELNDTFFGENWTIAPSFWLPIFEGLKNRRTLSRLLRADRAASGRILEIGVGTGSLLVAARSHGYSPSGCDLSEAVCRRVERRTGIAMHCGSIESLPPGDLFDVVVMNHVLEHVSDPVALLKAAGTRLRPSGVLHLAVPNVGSWEAGLPGWNSYEPYHLLYFTPRTLQSVVEMAGFRIQRLATHESFSGWFLAIARTLLGKPLSGRAEDAHEDRKQSALPIEHVYRLVMVAWGAVTTPVRRLQGILGKGDEVILVATLARDS